MLDLQEQHSDLLSLLAQQEVELSVFRSSLESRAGYAAVLGAEDEARKASIERYGSYTDFRQLEGDNELSNSQYMLSSGGSPIRA